MSPILVDMDRAGAAGLAALLQSGHPVCAAVASYGRGGAGEAPVSYTHLSGGEVPSPPDRDGASTLDFSVAAAGALFHLPKCGTANRVGADDREALFPPSLWWGLPHRHGRQGKARRRSVFHRSGEYCPPGRGETAPLPPSSGPLGQGWPSGLLGRKQLLLPGPCRALKGKERLSARLIPAPLKRELCIRDRGCGTPPPWGR